MPTYEYECTACGQHMEVFQRFSEDALTTCGVCGGVLRKVFHPAGIVFKGSGFYATDSRAPAKTGSGSKKDSDSEKKHDEFVQRMVERGYTERQVRRLVEWYMRVKQAS